MNSEANTRSPTHQVEVRVPTYRRHDLLNRALKSIAEQKHESVAVVVIDDCPDGSAESVTLSWKDKGLETFYIRNPTNLGLGRNLEKSFSNGIVDGVHGKFVCVLEDDKYWLPGYLDRNLETFRKRTNLNVCINSSYREYIRQDGSIDRTGYKGRITFGYGDDDRLVSLLERKERILLGGWGVGNLALFWKARENISFTVAETLNPIVQEHLRALVDSDEWLYLSNPRSVWTLELGRERFNTTEQNRIWHVRYLAFQRRLLSSIDSRGQRELLAKAVRLQGKERTRALEALGAAGLVRAYAAERGWLGALRQSIKDLGLLAWKQPDGSHWRIA